MQIDRWKWCQGNHTIVATVEQEREIEEDQGKSHDPFDRLVLSPMSLDDDGDDGFAHVYGRS